MPITAQSAVRYRFTLIHSALADIAHRSACHHASSPDTNANHIGLWGCLEECKPEPILQ
jgi:hypothetical protein